MRELRKQDGTPFANINMAKGAATRQMLEDYEVISVEGGFALRVPDAPDTQADLDAEIENEEEQKEKVNASMKKAAEDKEKSPDVTVTKPWRPTDITEIPEDCKDITKAYRFGSRNKRIMDQNLRNGWIVDTSVAKKMAVKGLIFANNSCDSTLIIGDLILLSMSKEREESREAYYRDKRRTAVSQTKQKYENKSGAKSIGSVEQEVLHV